MKTKPSIFNDVIGPIMRGPSSSHTAAAWRAAKVSMDVLNAPLEKAVIDFDKNGAWAPNYREQGTTLGIEGGLLGFDMTDDRMKHTEEIASERGIEIKYEISSFPTTHVNTFRLHLHGENDEKTKIVAVSLGGGSMEIRQIDGFSVKLNGGFYELLLFDCKESDESIMTLFPKNKGIFKSEVEGKQLINIKLSKPLTEEQNTFIESQFSFDKLIIAKPVLPVILGNEMDLPFSTVETLIDYANTENLDLGDLGLLYEKHKSGLTTEEVEDKMKSLINIIEGSISVGLSGTYYEDRILPQQSHLIEKAHKKGMILQNSIINKIIENVSAIMESKSAMEVVVANPTAGSCGAVGGVLKAVADDIDASREEITKAYFAAGLVGAYFAMGPGFSAEEHGCQVECGASAGMAAAGIAQLFGGSAEQAIDAASMAIQNMIGLVCDPIADRVEAPCLGKNVSAAVNALSSATMVCSGFNALIPLDEVIETVSSVSSQMPTCVKCTGKGGLAITKTACQIKKDLKHKMSINT